MGLTMIFLIVLVLAPPSCRLRSACGGRSVFVWPPAWAWRSLALMSMVSRMGSIRGCGYRRPFATRTRARYALFLELAADSELAEPLLRQRREFELWTERSVGGVGIDDPVPATRAIMALAEGLLLHRLTVDPALDLRPAIERAVRALGTPLGGG